MRDSRAGEVLWNEWTGDGYKTVKPTSTVLFYTEEHVDLENEIIRRALASSLQRSGTVVTLGDGYSSVESGNVLHGYAGYVDDSVDLYFCDEHGETEYGDLVDSILPITWVEM